MHKLLFLAHIFKGKHIGLPLLFAHIFLLGAPLRAQPSKLDIAIDALLQDPQLKYASVSFCAIDIEKNTVVCERNPNLALIPASSMKVITTSAALGLLGGDYQFRTLLQYDGSIENGVLRGNLYIKGGGDPTLGSPMMSGAAGADAVLNAWLAAIRKAGITRVEGAVVGDDSYFDSNIIPYTWQWGDMGNYYGAGVYGLNFNDNMYSLFFQQKGTVGETPSIKRVEPALPYLRFTNEVVSAEKGTGDNAYIFSSPYGLDIVIRGTIPAGGGEFRVRGALPNPPYFAAYSLTEKLKNSGIAVVKAPQVWSNAVSLSNRQTFHTTLSPPLINIVKHINEDSRNLYCEALLKAIGLKAKNAATFDAGLTAIMDFWMSRGVDMNGFFMHDGSGLSSRNSISARTFAQIMRKAYLDPTTFHDFYNQLAVAGETGTLAGIGKKTAAAGNIHAKSGSINRVRTYTGYASTRSGRMLAFSILVNNYSCSGGVMRKKLEELMIQIAQLP